jgi:hypothetical protein
LIFTITSNVFYYNVRYGVFSDYYCNFVLKGCVKWRIWLQFQKIYKIHNETTAILFFASSVSTFQTWNFLQIFKKEICESISRWTKCICRRPLNIVMLEVHQGGGWIGIYRSAQIWSKIRDPTMVLSKLESATSSTMKSQSRIQTKLQPKSTIRAKILDKSAVLTYLYKIHQIRNPNNFFCEIRRSENLFTPPPPPRQLPTYAKTVYWLFFLPVLF